jgi:predicted ATPase
VPVLVREATAERIELRNLPEASVRALVADRYSLSRRDHDRLVTYLQTHAEGHPLFFQELLRTLEEEQLLRQDGGGWVVGKFSRVPVLNEVPFPVQMEPHLVVEFYSR